MGGIKILVGEILRRNIIIIIIILFKSCCARKIQYARFMKITIYDAQPALLLANMEGKEHIRERYHCFRTWQKYQTLER